FKSLQQKLVVTGSKAQRPRGQNGLARHQVHERCVGAVPVDQQNLREAVVGDALGDVQAKSDESFRLDVDRARKVDVVQVQPISNGRQHQDPIRGPPPNLQADRLAKENVNVQWQVPAMLLG